MEAEKRYEQPLNTVATDPGIASMYNLQKGIWLKALAYVAPQLGFSLLFAPVITVLGGIYGKYYGVSLTTIATVMLVARIFDAVTDPLIGYYSDRLRARTGT